MEYGPSFGFRDTRGDARWTEGRYRLAAGSSLLLGTIVEVDLANPGFLKQSLTNAALKPKFCGLLLQELQFENSIFGLDPAGFDTYSYGVGHAGRLALITGAAGVKIWVKNLTSVTRSDGRVLPARTMYATTGTLAVGDSVGWDGTQFLKVGQSSITNAIATVTALSSTAGLELALIG